MTWFGGRIIWSPPSAIAPHLSMSLATAERVIRPRRGFVELNLAELWRYRELIGMFAWRDILLRYKQTFFGVAWAILQPLLTVVVFSVLFGRWAKFDSAGAPYPLLILAALLPWQLFATALTESSASLVSAARIISKVYFPRLIVPLSAIFSALVDAAITTLILFVLLPFYGVGFRIELLTLPLFFAGALLPAVAAGIWFSALNVRYRDVRYIIPFITRIGFYVTPVAFAWQSLVPESARLWYHFNPLVGVVDGFRWAILGDQFMPWWPGLLMGMGFSVVLLIGGLIYFRRVERTFADIV
jgi:lipopolysaccharide transport system permease protein